MSPEQRLIAAFSFQKSDRVARYEIFLPEYVRLWEQAYPAKQGSSIYDHYTKVDIGSVLNDHHGPLFSRRETLREQGTTLVRRDGWGRVVLTRTDAYFERPLEFVLADKSALDRLEFEPPGLEERLGPLQVRADELRGRFALVSGVLGLFMGAYRMRGEEQFLIDLAADRSFARTLIDRLEAFATELGLAVAARTKTAHTAVWVYDELASRTGPLMSPELFGEMFLPAYRRMISTWRDHGISRAILHCDGNSLPLFDLLEEAGFAGVQSMAPTAGMYLPEVKRRYGNRFILVGGMCNIRTLATGSKADIRRQAEEVVEAAKEGGVVIGTHSIDDSVSVENYEHYYAVMEECDRKW